MNCTYYDNLRYFDIVGITLRNNVDHTCLFRAVNKRLKYEKFNNLLHTWLGK